MNIIALGEDNMKSSRLGEQEKRFMDIVWSNEPISSGELVKECESILQWKKSTTYTVIKKLSEKGFVINNDTIVTSLVSEKRYNNLIVREFLDECFDGSLPAFMAAYCRGVQLTKEQIIECYEAVKNY